VRGTNCFWAEHHDQPNAEITLIEARMVAPRHQNTLTGDITVASGNDALRLSGK